MTASQRFLSLDVFRGLTVAAMILVNNPGSWEYVYAPLEHAKWHGCTPTDLVFPFFLFAVGNAMSFAMKKYADAGNAAVIRKILTRTLLIFGIGLLLNWFPFVKWADGHLVMKPLSSLRILGVFPRIALCYGAAALIVHYLKDKGAFVAACVILLGYWFVLVAFGAPGDPYSLQGYAGLPLDKLILGENHMYKGEGVPFDPEGILSTFPAICNVIFGYLAGKFIQEKGKTYEMLARLMIVGCLLIFAALCWDMVFPINKKIWTSSYVLYTVGIALLLLSILMYIVEFRGQTKWTTFFTVFGKNPLFIYVLSGVVVKLYLLIRPVPGQNMYSWLYQNVFQPIGGNMVGSFLFALFHVCAFAAIGYWMDKKKIYVRV